MTFVLDVKPKFTHPKMINRLIQYVEESTNHKWVKYGMVCRPVRGDNPRALASGLSPVQAD